MPLDNEHSVIFCSERRAQTTFAAFTYARHVPHKVVARDESRKQVSKVCWLQVSSLIHLGLHS